jgi:DNA primase
MPKALFVDFKAVKAAVSMEQVLQQYNLLDQFKRGGDSLSGPCPIHKGTNPTQFRVSVSKNVWNCFSECKHGGNVLDFIARMEGVSIHAAALKAINWFHLDPHATSTDSEEETGERNGNGEAPSPRKLEKPAEDPEKVVPNKPLKFRLEKLEREHPFLTERGLTLETLVDFGVGHCSKGMMAGRIAIPIHNVEGEVVAYAGRWPGDPPEGTPKYKLPQGFRKSLELYNIDRAIKEPPDTPLVVVEGFFLRVNNLSADEVLSEANQLYSRWPQLPVERKRKIVEGLLEKVVVEADGGIELNLAYLPTSEEMATSQQRLMAGFAAAHG